MGQGGWAPWGAVCWSRSGPGVWLALGVGLHLLLDAFQKREVDVYGMLFPLAWKDAWVGLFWADQSLYALPLLSVAVLLLVMGHHLAGWLDHVGALLGSK